MLSLLPSDYLLLFIALIAIFACCRVLGCKIQRQVWLQIFHKPLACCTTIILFFLVLIALLDSIHFQENGSYFTAFDKIIEPIGKYDEVSFSEPMATHSFVYETKQVAGRIVRQKPKLNYVKGRTRSENISHMVLDVTYGASVMLAIICLINFCQRSFKWKRWFRNPPGQVALGTITIFCFVIFSICFLVKDFSNYYFLLGTDKIGLDVLYMVLKGIRTGIALSLITIVLMVPLATIMGLSAGYFGGRIDATIQYIYITLSSIPGVLLIAASVLSLDMYMYKNHDIFNNIIFRSDMRLIALCCILGFTGWTSLCRLLRGEALKLRELDFVIHSKVVGMSSFKIIYKHLLPNVMHIIIITAVLDFSGLVLAETVLSYLGLGVDATMHSWGNLINSARLELARDPIVWWPLLGSITMMFVLVLSVNLLADEVRSIRDPRRL